MALTLVDLVRWKAREGEREIYVMKTIKSQPEMGLSVSDLYSTLYIQTQRIQR
jgi:hypothetical protein